MRRQRHHRGALAAHVDQRAGATQPVWPSARYSVPPATAKRWMAPSSGAAIVATLVPVDGLRVGQRQAQHLAARRVGDRPDVQRVVVAELRVAHAVLLGRETAPGALAVRVGRLQVQRDLAAAPVLDQRQHAAAVARAFEAHAREARQADAEFDPILRRRRAQLVEHHLHQRLRIGPAGRPAAEACVKKKPAPPALQATSPPAARGRHARDRVGQRLAAVATSTTRTVRPPRRRSDSAIATRRPRATGGRNRSPASRPAPLRSGRTPRARWRGRPPTSASPAPAAATAARSSARRDAAALDER